MRVHTRICIIGDAHSTVYTRVHHREELVVTSFLLEQILTGDVAKATRKRKPSTQRQLATIKVTCRDLQSLYANERKCHALVSAFLDEHRPENYGFEFVAQTELSKYVHTVCSSFVIWLFCHLSVYVILIVIVAAADAVSSMGQMILFFLRQCIGSTTHACRVYLFMQPHHICIPYRLNNNPVFTTPIQLALRAGEELKFDVFDVDAPPEIADDLCYSVALRTDMIFQRLFTPSIPPGQAGSGDAHHLFDASDDGDDGGNVMTLSCAPPSPSSPSQSSITLLCPLRPSARFALHHQNDSESASAKTPMIELTIDLQDDE